LNGIFVNN